MSKIVPNSQKWNNFSTSPVFHLRRKKMKNIKDYNLEDLKKELIELGEKPFRAEQIFKWIYEEKS